MQRIGKVAHICAQAYADFIKNTSDEKRINDFWSPATCIYGEENSLYNLSRVAEYKEFCSCFSNNALVSRNYGSIPDVGQDKIKVFEENNTPIYCVFRNEHYSIIKLGKYLYLYLNKYVRVQLYTNYDELTFSQITRVLGNSDVANPIAKIKDDVTKQQMLNAISKNEKRLKEQKDNIKKEIDNFKKRQEEELKRYESLLQQRQEQLSKQRERMLNELFILDNSLFNVRIALGDAFEVVHARSGARCALETPVIVYQKFRYLEEEIVKQGIYGETVVSAQNFCDNHNSIESIIAQNDRLLNTLCPTNKCVVVCKMTENNEYFQYDSNNLVKNIELLHGDQLCIICRDNECVDIVWLDENIILKDNVFITDNTVLEDSELLTPDTELRSKATEIALDRARVLFIIEILIRNKVLCIPDSYAQDIRNSEYIRFSNADKFITHKQYMSMSEYMRVVNKAEKCHKNDDIFVFQRITGSNYTQRNAYASSRSYTEYRGRGYADRAKDATVEQGFNKISYIEKSESKYDDEYNLYVSATKFWSDHNAKANIRIYDNEFINLTYVSTNLLKYWIESKDIGTRVPLSYAQVAYYLIKMYDIIKNRETKEIELIQKYCDIKIDSSTIDLLTRWKFENNVRSVNTKNVKQFVLFYTEQRKGE